MDELRYVIAEGGKGVGWSICTATRGWIDVSLAEVRVWLRGLGASPKDVDLAVSSSLRNPWLLVDEPYRPHELSERRWNRRPEQRAVEPAPNAPPTPPETWALVLEHAGAGLAGAVHEDAWCQRVGLRTGGDYLGWWLAHLLQDATVKLPFLFFYGPQNAGKSSFWEAASSLLVHGAMRAAPALNGRFCGELVGRVLCVLEEDALTPSAAVRLKDLITSPTMRVERKQIDAYQIPNHTHWIMSANSLKALPLDAGDTRTVIVPVSPPRVVIEPTQLRTRLAVEAPLMLAWLLAEELPYHGDRLALPVLATESKRALCQRSESALAAAMRERPALLRLGPEALAGHLGLPQAEVELSLLELPAQAPDLSARRSIILWAAALPPEGWTGSASELGQALGLARDPRWIGRVAVEDAGAVPVAARSRADGRRRLLRVMPRPA